MLATDARDFDAATSSFADGAVFDMTAAGLGRFEGGGDPRYLEGWIGSYAEQRFAQRDGEELAVGIVRTDVCFAAWDSRRRAPGEARAG
jgi:hypothetical protein